MYKQATQMVMVMAKEWGRLPKQALAQAGAKVSWGTLISGTPYQRGYYLA
jgi:hypothetical protein